MTKKIYKKINLGDIYAIPLPNGKYAFGRVFKETSIAVYKQIGGTIEEVPKMEDYQFIVGVYKDVLQDGKWLKVGNRPFKNDDDAWVPPQCVIDKITGSYSTYYKGEFKPSSKSECEGLEEVAAWESQHVVDRIMGEDKWHKR